MLLGNLALKIDYKMENINAMWIKPGLIMLAK